MKRSRPWAVVVTLATLGCNQVYDVRETKLVPPVDTDRDDVADEDDNCPLVPNGDQARARDSDAFGDACDLCPDIATAFNHDEDGDGTGDECDVCPGAAGFQVDDTGDGVGGACSPFPYAAPATRLLFDAFLALGPAWHSAGVEWVGTGDAVSPVTLPPATDPGLAVDGVSIDASAWLITVQFLSDRPWIDGDRFGIGLADTSGALVATCLVSCAMGNCRLEAFNGATLSGFVNIAVAQQFTLQFLTNNNPFLVCQSGSGTGIDKPAGALTPRLLATPEIQVTHIDVVVQD